MEIKEIVEFARKIFVDNEMQWFLKTHIEYVDKLAVQLAEIKNANKDVIRLAVWLHDIGHRNNGVAEDHHIQNSKFAVKLLTEKGFDADTVKAVEHCVLTHRCMDDYKPETLEAKVLASADAMSHIDNFSAMLCAVFVIKKLTVPEAYEWLSKKIDRDWNKKILLPEGKEIVKEKYEEVCAILDKMKKDK